MTIKTKGIITLPGVSVGGGSPASCAPALRSNYAASFSASAADIDGQNFSITSSTGAYVAHSDFDSPPSFSGSDIVAVEFVGVSFDVTMTYALLDTVGSAGIAITLAGSTWTLQAQAPFGSTTGSHTVSGAITDVIGLGVDKSTGEGFIYVNDTKITGGTFGSAAATIFNSVSNFAFYGLGQVSSGSMEANVITNVADQNHGSSYGANKDWCENSV